MFLLLASLADLKTGEVPEKYSMGLAGFILLVSLGDAVYSWSLMRLAQPVLWGAAYFIVAYVIFYFGQWGGGDVKLLAGIGGLLGYLDCAGFAWQNGVFLGYVSPSAVTYAVDMAVLATPYAVLYTLVLGVRRPSVLVDFLRRLASARSVLMLAFSLLPLIFSLYLGSDVLTLVYAFVPLLVVASVYMKTVEEVLLTKTVKVSELKEWDIMADDVVVDGVRVAPKGNIEGITPEQLSQVLEAAKSGRIPDTIRIRWGVKFVPALALALPATLYFGNLLELFFRHLFEVH